MGACAGRPVEGCRPDAGHARWPPSPLALQAVVAQEFHLPHRSLRPTWLHFQPGERAFYEQARGGRSAGQGAHWPGGERLHASAAAADPCMLLTRPPPPPPHTHTRWLSAHAPLARSCSLSGASRCARGALALWDVCQEWWQSSVAATEGCCVRASRAFHCSRACCRSAAGTGRQPARRPRPPYQAAPRTHHCSGPPPQHARPAPLGPTTRNAAPTRTRMQMTRTSPPSHRARQRCAPAGAARRSCLRSWPARRRTT